TELLVLANLGRESDLVADGGTERVGASADVPRAEGEAIGRRLGGHGDSSPGCEIGRAEIVNNPVCNFPAGQGALLSKNSREACFQRRGPMTLDDYILTVFCLIDDQLPALPFDPLRQRGFAPRLYDSEVLTIERVG